MEKDRLQFIFTEDSFRVDKPERALNEHEEQLKAAFLKDRFAALFHLGFGEETPGESPSLGFLRTLSECFIRSLTDMPELELTRENTHVEPDEDVLEELVCSVPFGLGTEYIGIAWIQLMYSRMNACFAAELKGYEGSVRMFLEEKSQRLRIPERVFFHVVENKDDDTFPFAFLATYATKDEEGRVRHMPLSFALTEYNGQRGGLFGVL